ncbi:MAG: RDD family protein [Porticoccaceae bacterium]|nr:MAG: RDD family protein [Porticoccaceae bacterium]
MSDSQPTAPAGLLRRLAALCYDTLLLFGVAFAYGVVVWALRTLAGQDTLEPLRGPAAVLELAGLALVLAGYYVLCWVRRGQTLGMKAWRLRVERVDGHLLDARTAWRRALLALVSALPVGLGYWWAWFDAEGRTWHDRWTATRVVKLPSPSAALGERPTPS